MCNCYSPNSKPSPLSTVYQYALEGDPSTPKVPDGKGKPTIEPGDILSDAKPPAAPETENDFLDASPGPDSTSMDALMQLLMTLLEKFKNAGIDGGNGGSSDKGSSPPVKVDPASKKSSPEGSPVVADPPAADAPAADAPSTPGGGLSDEAIAANPEVGKWNKEIDAASKATGLDPNQLGAQIWAESRGNLDTHTKNVDGTTDHGLIQIGQERWNRDVVPTLSAEDRAKIKEATGKEAEQLDVTQALDNVVAGAFHTRNAIDHKGGDLKAGLRYYNSGDAVGAGSAGYVNNVLHYMQELKEGKPLSQDPYNGTFGSGQGGII